MGHFDAASILERQKALVKRYEGLQSPLERQKSRLVASYQLQQLFRDLEDEEAWIKEREAAVASTNVGKQMMLSISTHRARAIEIAYIFSPSLRQGPARGSEPTKEASHSGGQFIPALYTATFTTRHLHVYVISHSLSCPATRVGYWQCVRKQRPWCLLATTVLMISPPDKISSLQNGLNSK